MTYKLMIIDDDANLLSGLKRQYHKRFDLLTAESGAQALELLKEHRDVGVVVTDMRMPEMDGLETLKHIREISPDVVRIMLTGNADQQTAIDAVNEGEIFRFYNKPCDADVLAKGIDAGFRQYRLVIAEKELLEQTLSGTVKVLVDLLAFSNPQAFGRSTHIKEWCDVLAPKLGIEHQWVLRLSAMLLPLCDLILPPEMVSKMKSGDILSDSENEILQNGAATVHDMIMQIPRLEKVAEIIAQVRKPLKIKDPEEIAKLPIEARLLHILEDLSWVTTELSLGPDAFDKLIINLDTYDNSLYAVARSTLLNKIFSLEEHYEALSIPVMQLTSRQILLQDINTDDGRKLLSKGAVLSTMQIEKLKLIAMQQQVSGSIHVAQLKKYAPSMRKLV
ncbi:Response regulator containing a CheY-like receiver domain and an HD-GYP domain [Candidatus Terasakiella magnetica]|uniref:Response regulator containing a CheY-like receiver domain and an HD-GYP domain n=1 Tax=Candidatus Terasakiella magnetica TaxID=1867952 RepID=A0A1C3RJ22_9PROT|nr:response regulator [Candidatus Terasakiella magnetica]SCA57262.1 Response regulator containing a CheY-like receiver domain and an HD-GYP domain [Candidatus Terasakiella magnetica]